MPIYREIECSSYEEVEITMKDIAEDIIEKDAIKLIKLLINKFPNLFDGISIKENGIESRKLFPELQKLELIKKYQNEYKSLNEFTKSKSKS